MKVKKIAIILKLLTVIILTVCLISCKEDPVIPQISEATISHLEFVNIIGEAEIDRENQTVTAQISDRPNSNMEQLILTFRLSNGATAFINDVEQFSGITANDFSVGDVEYKVVSGDKKTTKIWTVTILKRHDTATYKLNGLIKENTILTAAIYEVKDGLEIAPNIYLAIEPGTTFKLAPCARIILNDSSRFFANGTEANPIKFTSMNESNELGNGAWGDFYIKNPRVAEFTYCIFENGGGCNNRPLMFLENSNVGIKFCTFRNILNTGIFVDERSMFRIFEGNKMENVAETVENNYPIHFKNINSTLNIRNDNLINSEKGIFIETANISTNLTFSEQTCPYVFGTDISHSGENTVVFIQPGVKFMMKNGASINLGNGNSSIRFVAQGTQEKPIKFYSRENQPGSWQGIIFGSRVLAGSVLDYCEINFAGNGESGAIRCVGTDSTRLSISNSIIRNTNSHGIFVAKGATVQLDVGTIQFFNIPFGFSNYFFQP